MSQKTTEKEKADPAFVERIKLACAMAGGRKELAARSGLSVSVIDKYVNGKSDPSRQRLVAIAEAAGVSLQWLATGKHTDEAGPTHPACQAIDAPPPLDTWLFSRAIDGIRQVYKRIGGQIQTINEVELAVELHHKILALVDGNEARQGALIISLDQLEKDLLAAAKTKGDDDKRTA